MIQLKWVQNRFSSSYQSVRLAFVAVAVVVFAAVFAAAVVAVVVVVVVFVVIAAVAVAVAVVAVVVAVVAAAAAAAVGPVEVEAEESVQSGPAKHSVLVSRFGSAGTPDKPPLLW